MVGFIFGQIRRSKELIYDSPQEKDNFTLPPYAFFENNNLVIQ